MEETVYEIHKFSGVFPAKGFAYKEGMAYEGSEGYDIDNRVMEEYDNEDEARKEFAEFCSTCEKEGSEVRVTEYALTKSIVEWED